MCKACKGVGWGGGGKEGGIPEFNKVPGIKLSNRLKLPDQFYYWKCYFGLETEIV